MVPFITSHRLDLIPRCTGTYPSRSLNPKLEAGAVTLERDESFGRRQKYENGGHLYVACCLYFRVRSLETKVNVSLSYHLLCPYLIEFDSVIGLFE